jgi:hypothetical protein
MLLTVEHEKCAQHNHQQRPESGVHDLPASRHLGQSSESTDTESGEGKVAVLGLDARHCAHVPGTVHSRVVLVKKQQHRTKAASIGMAHPAQADFRMPRAR